MAKPNNTPTEHEECVVFKQWLELKGLKFTHIPNETRTPYRGVWQKNKAIGVVRGFPDYCVLVTKGILFIEMKRVSGGNLSPEQAEWIAELNKIPNVEATVCKGADEAIAFVSQFLK